jgi:hypothetical protein
MIEEPTPGEALIGTVLAGRYRIEKLLGTGGMGAVYRAEHVHMRKAVAVKVLHREMTLFPEVVARFEREAVAAGRIEHPNVAAATDFGRLEDGSFYLVLEYVEGRSLSKLIEELERVPEERALHITRQIAAALSAAHAAAIVHRDLKPDNVMLVEREGVQDFVKVLDFGIAKVNVEGGGEQPALTQAGTVFGTPEYMSPEQARGDLVDARADLYTVGMILYEMLAGQSPFKDDDLVVILTRQLTMEPPPLPGDVSEPTSELVLHLLKKAPAARPQTADEVIGRIDAILGISPPPSAVLASAGGPPSSAAVPAASVRNEVAGKAAYAPTLLNAPGAASADNLASRARTVLERAGRSLRRPLSIRGGAYPVWLVGVLGAVLVAGFVVTLWLGLSGSGSGSGPGAGVEAALEAVTAPRDDELRKLVERAESGDRTALAELAARDEKKRTGMEWRALGHGYATIGDFAASLRAYQAGLAAEPALAQDPVVIGDLERAVEHEETSAGALELALEALGAMGADLIYAAWDAARGSPQKAALAKRAKALLDRESLRAKASPALAVALELSRVQKAEGCAGVKKVLPRAAEAADERALPLLKKYNDRRGCGFLGLRDCFACLRRGKELEQAIVAAESRKAPEFFLRRGPEKPASSVDSR